MKSKVRLIQCNYIFQVGYPAFLAAAYEMSKDNHIAEIWTLNVNYNSTKTQVAFTFASINGMLKRDKDIESVLGTVIDFHSVNYQETLYEKNDELVNKSLPLRPETMKSPFILQFIPNFEDLKVQIIEKTENLTVHDYFNNLSAIKLDFKSK